MNIYYSRSNNVDDSVMNVHIGTFIQNLPEQLRSQVTLTKYERGTTYDPQLLHKADLVIVGMPELNPDAYLGKGCFTEVETALKEHKPVLIISKDSDEGRIMMQTIQRSDLNNCGDTSVNYGKFYLYHSYDESYVPACNEHNMIFDINSTDDIHDAMQRLEFIGDGSPIGDYNFDDEISFVVKDVKYKFTISSDWLNPEDVDIDHFFYKVLGVTDGIINTAVQELSNSTEEFDNVNLWPIRNRRVMNKVISLVKSWVDVANGVEVKLDVSTAESVQQELPLPDVDYQVVKPNPPSFISDDDELLLLM